MSPRRRLAVVVLTAITLAAGSVAADEVKITPEARKHFEVGVALLEDPEGARHEEAYRAFKAAYAAAPSPKILGNIGLCAMKLERDSEAIKAYGRYLKEVADIEAKERSQIESDLKTLRASVVTLELSISPSGATVIDERTPVKKASIINRYGPTEGKLVIGVRAGNHRITIEKDGHKSEVWELEAEPGKTVSKTIELPKDGAEEPAPSPGIRLSVPTWIGIGVTAAAAVGAAVTGGLALSKQSAFKDGNDGSDPAAAQDLKDQGEMLNIVTDVLMGTAVLGAGVTTILLFTTGGDEPSEGEGNAAWHISPVAGPGGAALMAWGSF